MQPEGQNYWQGESGAPVDSPVSSPQTEVAEQPITWDASEYIHHHKSPLWYIGLIVGTFILAGLAIFLIQSWTFTALIVVAAVAVIVLALRQPRTLHYVLSAQGLQIDEKVYSYHDFRAFGIVQEGPLYSISLIPTKRFMPAVNVYFPQEIGERIVDMLGSMVPMERIELDLVDKLVRKLRF